MPKVINAKSWQLTPAPDGRRYSKYPDGTLPTDPEPPVPGVDWEFPSGTTPTASAATLTAVPTFHCVSLYWPEASGATSNECYVRYREAGSPAGDWRQALSLWWDYRDVSVAGDNAAEYRGSIVYLTPGTEYEIEVLTGGTRRLASTTVSTWSETFTIASTTTLPTSSSSQLTITTGGSAGTGYVLYTHAPAGSAAINVNKGATYCVRVDADYVIVRGLTLSGASNSGVYIEPGRHHVVVEDCEITGWGSEDNLEPPGSGWGRSAQSGIRLGTSTPGTPSASSHIVIQNNNVHTPTYTTNSWAVYRDGRNTFHPVGPSAIWLSDPAGQVVVRYNWLHSDLDHMMNDVISGETNYTGAAGNFGKDSDIYGNDISHCWDDGIECEGMNINTRIFENYITWTYVAIANAVVAHGPLYIFRNVAAKGIYSLDDLNRGNFWKMRQLGTNNGGRSYLIHNTIRRTPGTVRNLSGFDSNQINEIYTRNNIWDAVNGYIPDFQNNVNCSFNYDVFTGTAAQWSGHQADGISQTSPTYDAEHASGVHTLADASAGRNAGQVIPNFNDGYSEAAPDIGAQERGATALQFGIRS